MALEQRGGRRANLPPQATPHDRGVYSADRFVFDLASDPYHCPAGQPLTRQGSSHTAGASGGLIDRARPKAYPACPATLARKPRATSFFPWS